MPELGHDALKVVELARRQKRVAVVEALDNADLARRPATVHNETTAAALAAESRQHPWRVTLHPRVLL